MAESTKNGAHSASAVAIVGVAGRFPGLPNVSSLWGALRSGRETITFFSEAQLAHAGVRPELLADTAYVRARGVLEDADRFDAALFGISPREAELMDPQQRVFLECAWTAFEDAGYDPERYTGRVGVFAGSGVEQLSGPELGVPPRALQRRERASDPARERKRQPGHARLVQAEPQGAERHDPDQLLDLSGCGCLGLRGAPCLPL